MLHIASLSSDKEDTAKPFVIHDKNSMTLGGHSGWVGWATVERKVLPVEEPIDYFDSRPEDFGCAFATRYNLGGSDIEFDHTNTDHLGDQL